MFNFKIIFSVRQSFIANFFGIHIIFGCQRSKVKSSSAVLLCLEIYCFLAWSFPCRFAVHMISNHHWLTGWWIYWKEIWKRRKFSPMKLCIDFWMKFERFNHKMSLNSKTKIPVARILKLIKFSVMKNRVGAGKKRRKGNSWWTKMQDFCWWNAATSPRLLPATKIFIKSRQNTAGSFIFVSTPKKALKCFIGIFSSLFLKNWLKRIKSLTKTWTKQTWS